MVTGVAEPDEDESDADEPDEVELDAADVFEVDACVVVWLASAGSWPETSWMTIPPVVVKKRAVAAPTTRRRMRLTRSRRFCRGVEDMGTAWAPYFGSA